MAEQIAVEEFSVQLASRKDLFRVVAFLEDLLPQECLLHGIVQAALLSSDPLFRIYFIPYINGNHSNKNNYLAIAAFKEERTGISSFNSKPRKTMWFSAAWCLNNNSCALQFIYDSMNGIISWSKDELWFFIKNPEMKLFHLNYLKHNHGRADEEIEFNIADQYVLDKSSFSKMRDDSNVISIQNKKIYIQNLERCHADIVLEHWPLKKLVDIEDIKTGIDQFPSVGVFLKENDQLVSWATHFPVMGLSRLTTLESHRHQGYAQLVIRSFAKNMFQAGYAFIWAGIVVENTASKRLFESLGFTFQSRLENIIVKSAHDET